MLEPRPSMGRLSRSRPMANQPRSSSQKSPLKARLSVSAFRCQRAARGSSPVAGRDRGPGAVRRVHVALHLAQGDRRVGQAAVVAAHGVPRVLPALVGQPAGVRSEVLDVAIAVPVAEVLDPGERAVGVGQQPGQLLGRQPPAGQLAEQHDEQRRGVDRPVVGRATLQGERVRAVEAGLVHDPPRLLLRPGVDVLALEVGQRVQHAEGQRGIDRQGHQRGPQRVAPEQGHEPRSAGGHDGEPAPGGVEQAQRGEVGQ